MGELLGGLQDQTFARAIAATAISYPAERRLTGIEWPGSVCLITYGAPA